MIVNHCEIGRKQTSAPAPRSLMKGGVPLGNSTCYVFKEYKFWPNTKSHEVHVTAIPSLMSLQHMISDAVSLLYFSRIPPGGFPDLVSNSKSPPGVHATFDPPPTGDGRTNVVLVEPSSYCQPSPLESFCQHDPSQISPRLIQHSRSGKHEYLLSFSI